MFNDGQLEIYSKVSKEGEGGKPFEVLKPYATAYYGEIGFTVEEYYTARQTETEVVKRIRIHQDKSISNKHVIVIDGIQYNVGRTYSATVKGIAVTDITLEEVSTKYDFA